MATSYEVIYLGNYGLIDADKHDETAELAENLLGSYGSGTSPLYSQVKNLTPERLSEDDNDTYDVDNGGGYDSFRINGGSPQLFDAVAIFNADVIYADGTTAQITAVVFQDTYGNTYLAPDQTAGGDNTALGAKPIASIDLVSVYRFDGNEGDGDGDMHAYRAPVDFIEPVDGTAGNDFMGIGYTDAQGDQIGDGGDVILAGDGDDTVDGARGKDTIYGGAGNDSITGGDDDDLVYGGSGNDTLVGGPGHDTIYGGDGDDVLGAIGGSASHGDDLMFGDAGNDTIYFGNSQNTVDGGADADYLWSIGSDFNKIVAGGEGGTDDDTISWYGSINATDNVNVVFFGDENGEAYIRGQTVTFSEIENVEGTYFNDTIDASATTSGRGLFGLDGDDSITGGSGNDTIDAGTGQDTVRGGAGDDLIQASGASTASNSFFGEAGNDTLSGSDGADTLDGGEGDDIITGYQGDDVLIGGDGNDMLTGGAGGDSLIGGTGNDTFYYFGGNGADTISDFNVGITGEIGNGIETDNDFIDLSAFYGNISQVRRDFDDDGILNQSTATANGGTEDFGGATLFQSGDSILFENVTRTDFTTDNTGVACFTSGTRILTARGPVAVENLRLGEQIITRDHGLQPLRWIGVTKLSAQDLRDNPKLRPIRIKREVFGSKRDLVVSPQHCMLHCQGGTLRLVRAVQMLKHGWDQVNVAQGKTDVTYLHLLFDQHQIIFAEGAATESMYPGPLMIASLNLAQRSDLFAVFPQLARIKTKADAVRYYGPHAYPVKNGTRRAQRRVIVPKPDRRLAQVGLSNVLSDIVFGRIRPEPGASAGMAAA